MAFDPTVHHRRSIRLKDYDYSQNGAYFVTLCTWQRECLFGDIMDGNMRMSETGLLVEQCWQAIAASHVQLDEFIIMPN
ncbi:MAG TPA: transposase, partial [Desulfuromonadaceae bacterium]